MRYDRGYGHPPFDGRHSSNRFTFKIGHPARCHTVARIERQAGRIADWCSRPKGERN
jgi:hypothetical protein